ncbi:hypothetical protein [Natronococcus zhouii]|nr:hypothetical protein [Natronococcus sp. CG52]
MNAGDDHTMGSTGRLERRRFRVARSRRRPTVAAPESTAEVVAS